MADTRFELRLCTCPWCGDEVQEETIPGKPGRTRQWVPGTDSIHHHTLEQVVAYGAQWRAEHPETRVTRKRPAPPPRPQPSEILEEYSDEL